MGYGLYFFIDIQTSSKPQQKTRLVVIEDKDESPGTTRARPPNDKNKPSRVWHPVHKLLPNHSHAIITKTK